MLSFPQVSADRSTWTPIHSESGKSSDAQTVVDVSNLPDAFGKRYLRVHMTQRRSGYANFSIYFLRIYRKPFIISSNPTGLFCGATITDVSTYLLGKYGGSLIHTYENAEFFSAALSQAQQEAMFEDKCVFTVETNYVVRARGVTTTTRALDGEEQRRRRLAIPEFNLKERNVASKSIRLKGGSRVLPKGALTASFLHLSSSHLGTDWGLERISSRGARNGAYMWLHEGLDTNIYIFDTGIYPEHSDWVARPDVGKNSTYPNHSLGGEPARTRFGDTLICAGQANDYESTDHGTFVASIAAGWTFGTARSAIFHSIQVLDASGEGSTASLLCGMEKLLQDGKDYNAANYPKKIRSLVNLSLGVNGRSDALDKAVKDMTDVGYTVVIAAGDHNGAYYEENVMSRCYITHSRELLLIHRKCVLLQPLRSHCDHSWRTN